MDLNDFRSFILDSGLDVWTWIDMAISVASADHENELKNRRDGIIQKLYASRCQNCDHLFFEGSKCEYKENEKCEQKEDVGFDYNGEELQKEEEDEDEDDDGDNDDEQRKIIEIKSLLDDENQSDGSLIVLLQRLVDMNTTFKALKETDIGRHVTKFRKHSSIEVRRLVKVLVRKWKDTVDEWVRLNAPLEEATQINGDEKSPKEAHQDSTHNGVKAQVLHNGDSQNTSVSCYLTPPKGKLRHNQNESENLSSKRLGHDQHYQETHHAKKQKTVQVKELCNIPKSKNNIVFTNSGGRVLL